MTDTSRRIPPSMPMARQRGEILADVTRVRQQRDDGLITPTEFDQTMVTIARTALAYGVEIADPPEEPLSSEKEIIRQAMFIGRGLREDLPTMKGSRLEKARLLGFASVLLDKLATDLALLELRERFLDV